MARVKRSNKRTERRKKFLKLAKGYWGGKSRMHRIARLAVERGLQFAYRDRRNRKRDFRRLWIVRINAACREQGLNYSTFMRGLRGLGVELNRKVLADMAVQDPAGFKSLAEQARSGKAVPV